jgi:DNA-binding transcriptional LysR family regulator
MELRRPEAFVTVAEERNSTRTARRLPLAQSALQPPSALERELRASVFSRTARHVEVSVDEPGRS